MSLAARARAAGAHPRLEPAVALALRARTVRRSWRFALRELLRRRGTVRYRLRGSDLDVLVRHVSADVVTLGEIFHRPDYAPPDAVRAALGPPDRALRVVDLGANIGLFGAYLHGLWPRAEIVAVEADPDNARLLRAMVAANGLGWRVVEAVAAARDGEVAFLTGADTLSRLADPGEAGATTLAALDVLPLAAGADLLKLDIEGGEWEVLGDERFGREGPRAVVLEYHPRLAPGPNPHAALERRLRELGYAVHVVWRREDGHGLAWGWR
jgi:FkbM family methyltransferase